MQLSMEKEVLEKKMKAITNETDQLQDLAVTRLNMIEQLKVTNFN